MGRVGEDLIGVIATGRVSRGQVDHEARKQLAWTLEQNGPLTARGLARENERTIASVKHHLGVLSRAGVVAPFGGCQVAGEEIAYTLTLERVPEWAQKILLGELSMQTAMRLMAILMLEGTLTPTKLAARTGLNRCEVARYMRALHAKGWAETAREGEVDDRADRVGDYPEWFKRWLRAVAEGDDEEDEERKSP